MATLTQTAYWTRKIMLFGAIGLVVIIFLKISLDIVGNTWRKFNPPAPPSPTVTFGPLPKLIFPNQTADKPKLTFRLETIQGDLPKLPSQIKVYFMPKPGPNLLALDRAQQKAQKMGFRNEMEKISDVLYRWNDQKNPPMTLEMDINNGNFHLLYPYQTDQAILGQKNLPTNQQAAQEAKNFLLSNDLLAADLATGSAEFEYLKLITPQLTPAISLSEADFIRANLFRTGLDGLKILPPNPKEALISFLFSGAREFGKRLIEVNYNYSPIDTETFSTYPLKTVTLAWQEMQSGQAYLANLGQNPEGNITIRQIYLAYYDSQEPQNFLQPVFVFEGDRNFIGYVPAIDPKWREP